jgi:maltooligosyltrehalose trehalohydrolase
LLTKAYTGAAGLDAADTPLGASYGGEAATFLVWAPATREVEIHIVTPQDRRIRMHPAANGYFYAVDFESKPGTRYFYCLDGKKERPDPASRSQPEGVHGPSEIVTWRRSSASGPWRAPKLRDYILYEIHPGTFTPEGTLEAIIPELDRLSDLGITALEIMPVAEFPGGRNWGYDGVFPFAVEQEYGGLRAFRRLIHACHEREIAVILDVVYNHLGPEGNYLADFGPYFTDQYRTPWGQAVNFDGPESDQVRRYFIENALFWVRNCEIDGLRLDAAHAIIDRSSTPFLEELAAALHRYALQSGREINVFAESDLNDARLIRPARDGGYGLDAQWADDFHHSLHTLLTGERHGYYADFGTLNDFATALQNGWTYDGRYSSVRRRRFGSSPAGLSVEQFVVCAQNHDQVGNRVNGERLSSLVNWERAKLAASAVLLSPFTPLLFMGEEYAEPAPFLYFVSHSDPELQRAVREGRRAEFKDFAETGEIADPQSPDTFLSSKLRTSLAHQEPHKTMHAFYSELIRVRKTLAPMRPRAAQDLRVSIRAAECLVEFESQTAAGAYRVILNFDEQAHRLEGQRPGWTKRLDSSDPRWAHVGERGSHEYLESHVQPLSCCVFAAS